LALLVVEKSSTLVPKGDTIVEEVRIMEAQVVVENIVTIET
jgi:hypothetical protein